MPSHSNLNTLLLDVPVPKPRNLRRNLEKPSRKVLARVNAIDDTEEEPSTRETITEEPITIEVSSKKSNMKDTQTKLNEVESILKTLPNPKSKITKYNEPEKLEQSLIEAVNMIAEHSILQSTSSFSSLTLDSKQPENPRESVDKPKTKPAIVGVIPKVSSTDTFSRKLGFKIGSSMVNLAISNDTPSIRRFSSERDLTISKSSSSKNIEVFETSRKEELDDKNFDFELFDTKLGKRSKSEKTYELFGIHCFEEVSKDDSFLSMKDENAIPGFISGPNMKKWKNRDELDEISLFSESGSLKRSDWVIGDNSDTGMSIFLCFRLLIFGCFCYLEISFVLCFTFFIMKYENI